MSFHIDKLGIQGIRSFSHSDQQVIYFYTPVTLIVGANGAGKTTVIECLKLATTGQLPANVDKGHSFIHDPQIEGVSEVRGQIRLMFTVGSRKRKDGPQVTQVCAIRSFQLSSVLRKGNITYSFKNLESILKTKDSSDQVSSGITKRCADMDIAISDYLRISKPILENVCFCHQEDNNWPLGDRVILKKKIDEIFGSARYSKALGEIDKLRKETNRQMKEAFSKIELFEKDYLRKSEIQSNLQTLTQKANKLSGEIAETENINIDLENARSQINEINGEIQEYSIKEQIIQNKIEKVGDLKDVDIQKDMVEKLLEKLENMEMEKLGNIDFENIESLNKLHTLLDKYSIKYVEKLDNLKNQSSDLNNQLLFKYKNNDEIRQLDTLLSISEKRINELQIKLTKSQEEYQCNSDNINNLSRTEKNANYFKDKLSELNETLQEKQLNKNRINEKIREEEINLNRSRAMELRSIAIQKELDQYISEIGDLELKMNQTKSSISIEQDKLSSLSNDHESLCIEIAKISKIHDPIIKLCPLYDKLSTIQKQIDNLKGEMIEIENDLYIDDIKLKISNKSREISELKIDEIKCKYSEINGSRAMTEREFDKTQKDLEKITQTIQSQILDKNIDILKIFKNLCIQDKIIDNHQLDPIDTFNLIIKSSSELQEFLKKLEDKISPLSRDIYTGESAEYLYSKIEKSSIHKCEICLRDFKNGIEKDVFSKRIESLKKRAPQSILKSKAIYEDLTRLMKFLKNQFLPIFTKKEEFSDRCKILKSENLKNINEKFTASREELEMKEKIKEKLDGEMNDLSEKLNILSKNLAISEKIEKIEKNEYAPILLEIGNIHVDNIEIQNVLNFDNVFVNHQSIFMINDKLSKILLDRRKTEEKLSIEIKDIHSKINNNLYPLEVSLYDLMKTKENKVNSLKIEQGKMVGLEISPSQSSENLKKELDIETRNICQIEGEIEIIKKELTKYEGEMSRLINTRDILSSQMNSLNLEIQEENQSYHENIGRRDNINTNESMNHSITTLEEEIQSLKNTYENLNKLHVDISEVNIKITRKIQHLSNIQNLKELKIEIQKIQFDKNNLLTKLSPLEELIKSRNDDLLKIEYTRGELNNIQSQINDLNREMELKYLNIESDLNKYKIEYQVYSQGADDLKRYYIALDSAIMKYHEEKMVQINARLKWLWKKIYRGSDIDHVYLSSEGIGDKGIENRVNNFQYKVMMVLNTSHGRKSSPIEMRGRCSAGQKVITSLLIRLSLAEVFMTNNGGGQIMTLDEPTTNLDEANIKSLAEAIADLIRLKSDKKYNTSNNLYLNTGGNYQIIIITHDDHFVNLLGQLEVCEDYVLVSKDEAGYSQFGVKKMKLLR